MKIRRSKLWMHLMLLLRRLYSPPQNVYKHLYFYGPFTVYANTSQFKLSHIGTPFENNIFWKGLSKSWEYQSILFWEKLAINSSVIMDIGANSGFYSILSKAVNPSSDVYAFEPVKRNADIFRKNVVLNNFDIKIIEKAASNMNGVQTLYDIPLIPNNRQASLSNANYDNGNAQAIDVVSIRLDDFIQQNKISRLDLIKIDVEEHEKQVLEGFSKYLNLYKPALLIEILNREISVEIEKQLRGAGYGYFINVSEESGLHTVSSLEPKVGRNFFCFVDQNHCEILSAVQPEHR